MHASEQCTKLDVIHLHFLLLVYALKIMKRSKPMGAQFRKKLMSWRRNGFASAQDTTKEMCQELNVNAALKQRKI